MSENNKKEAFPKTVLDSLSEKGNYRVMTESIYPENEDNTSLRRFKENKQTPIILSKPNATKKKENKTHRHYHSLTKINYLKNMMIAINQIKAEIF